ncbi:MAG: D-alanine--D-alanine ligase [Deltaproteobacteria bacterium]|nr:D-alanine--D-alanine ligase [Deltaproteobacteria bacterium]
MKYKRIGVLYGGISREREVSLAGGRAVADALERTGHQVVRIDVTHQLDKQLRDAAIDAAFIVLHGRHGEDGTVQGMLEMMQIPYTGSGVLASALAIDKVQTRRVLQNSGIRVAGGFVVVEGGDNQLPDGVSLPVVVKPAEEGSSVGVSIARTASEYQLALTEAFKCSRRILVEEFVAGKEVQVAVLDDQVLGAVEIEPHNEFYDYDAKYTPGASTHHIPPRITDAQTDAVCKEGKKVFDAIGCSGAARVDFILTPSNEIFCLEINTIPGMTPTSLLPEIAAHAGTDFEQLVALIADHAKLHI